MFNTEFDVVGIGNAIVDISFEMNEEQLEENKLVKSSMTLASMEVINQLCQHGVVKKKMSGGSAANTIAALSAMSCRTGFIGKVCNDDYGNSFVDDMRRQGVKCVLDPVSSEAATSVCAVMITPDAERTMVTYLGASCGLSASDIDAQVVQQAKITYVEGYLWDLPDAKLAIKSAIAAARDASRQVAFSLSDAFCVVRHHADFSDMVRHNIDILFGNQHEFEVLFNVNKMDDVMAGCHEIPGLTAVITCGRDGAWICGQGTAIHIPAVQVPKVYDKTGAGDNYAAGFLYGLVKGYDTTVCAQMASAAAAKVIQQYGTRLSSQVLGDIAQAFDALCLEGA